MRGRFIDRLMIHAGSFAIFVALVVLAHGTPEGIQGSALWIMLGAIALAVHGAGILNVAGRTFNNRKFLQLRAEIDEFIAMARHLNRHALAEDEDSVARTVEAMHRSVDKMSQVAGIAD